MSCDLRLEDGFLLLAEDGGELLLEECVPSTRGMFTGGSISFPVAWIEPTPLVDEEEELVAITLALARRRGRRKVLING